MILYILKHTFIHIKQNTLKKKLTEEGFFFVSFSVIAMSA